MPEGLPAYVLVARIASVVGMALSLAIGLLLLLGALWIPSLIAFTLFAPAFGLMLFAERLAAASLDR
ncbi:MAG: hypothetical protein QF664_03580 [Dehalococcoidia bacterium]|jgi:hypothetical protein|nr:hypothetical protein [Dehalococcoidia bacterium]